MWVVHSFAVAGYLRDCKGSERGEPAVWMQGIDVYV